MASEPPRRPSSGPRLGPKLGFDDNEQKEFTRALKQGLLVQTPLQVLLETLFSRLQTQAGLFGELTRRVDRLEARDLDAHELLHRLQLCEGKVAGLTASKLSPFKQQEILGRLDALEKRADVKGSGAGSDVGGGYMEDGSLGPVGDPASVEARLAAVEGKLGGVYNLTGKLIAVDHMASELGIDVPDLEYNPGMITEAFFRRAADPSAPALPSNPVAPPPAPAFPAPPATITIPIPVQPAPHNPEGSVATSPTLRPKSGVGADVSMSRLDSLHALQFGATRTAELKAQVAEVAAANETLRLTVATLNTELHQARHELNQRQALLAGRVDGLEAVTRGMDGKLAEQEQALAAATAKNARRDWPETSYADFCLLQSQVEAVVRDVQGTKETVSGIKDQDLKSLSDAIAELRDASRKGDVPRDMDTLFHQRLSAIETRYGDLRAEVQAAAADALQDVAHASDIDRLTRELEARATLQDIRQLALQQQTLAQSVNGMAEWLSVRPETSDGSKGTGSSATKFKCLTCDREIKTQSGSNGNPTLKGSFLPKLEGMHPTLAAPIGPGLNTARRQPSPGRTKSPWGTGVPPLGQEQAAAQLEDGAAASAPAPLAPPQGPGTDAGLSSPGPRAAGPGGGPPTKLPPGPRVPVFL